MPAKRAPLSPPEQKLKEWVNGASTRKTAKVRKAVADLITVDPGEEHIKTLTTLKDKHDISRLDPRLIKLVAWLLSIPGCKWDTIAQASGLQWNTVAAIAAARPDHASGHKARHAASLSLVLEASAPHLLDRANRGDLDPFQHKLLSDLLMTLSGEATVRIEHVRVQHEAADDVLRMLEGVTVTTASGD